ncbi:hypothetical protein BC828DRAFT_373424 [Blastocladiella britannica]|nr:hypothetical protein BC828DRAFT_373424 [Blastocladiella britannica]
MCVPLPCVDVVMMVVVVPRRPWRIVRSRPVVLFWLLLHRQRVTGAAGAVTSGGHKWRHGRHQRRDREQSRHGVPK